MPITTSRRRPPSPAVQCAPRAAALRLSVHGGRQPGVWSLRIPLEHLGARVFPDMFSLAQAHKAFGEDGGFVDGQLAARFEENLRAFLHLEEAAKHYPCIKKAWVEFLGEPGATVGRVEACNR